ncbi:MAG: hypothetical protein J5I90_16745 [Caldilineales bacterium]|nr:hypothetical protein [Caldilineales bacterium]
MAEAQVRIIACPYLRGRRSPEPELDPGDFNHCILAASIHLPRTQQMRYCLGGNHEQCPRFQRQATQPLPTYVTGIPPAPPVKMPPKPDLPDLPWRSRRVRRIARWLPILILLLLLFFGWRYQQSNLQPTRLVRPPLPTPIATPGIDQSGNFNPALLGPAQP